MTSRCGWRASLKSRFQCPRQPGFDSQYRQIGKRHFLFALFGAMLSTDNDLYFLRLSLHTSGSTIILSKDESSSAPLYSRLALSYIIRSWVHSVNKHFLNWS
ncbi:hypothetical protein HBH53_043330 [Parastagonospora nodorum]|nr:hypothetical protein HBH53_043330 [Parastagonospora nodorum]KAH5066074.1 hypothetical protein HBI73_197870 [Parastagonospora nodorum]KAH5157830.1 hypothetical protein HBH69_073940 [Parastagonospora nodorum]KAH6257721.1 hypothetical protein HBI41_156980 [Parastagonospora nodorum]KAH6281002.1 hypothetical protein HBI40_168110 [Parastagonospora nodorum]